MRIDPVDAGEAFPHFARAAGERGVVGVLSVPATWGGEIIATLNLYSRTGPFDESATTVGAVLAAQVAIDDRANVHVSTGLLMATQGCTAEQAEGLLRQAAEHEAKTILEIAYRIIEQHNTSR